MANPRIVLAIETGAITEGMSQEQVIASWGEPCCSLINGVTHTAYGDVWRYTMYEDIPGTYIYFDRTGHVIYWTQSSGGITP